MDYEKKIKDEVRRTVGPELTRAIMNPEFIKLFKMAMGEKPEKKKTVKKKDDMTGELF